MSVEVTRTPEVAWVTFSGTRGNVLDTPTIRGLEAAVDETAGDSGLKLIVFEGAGKDFSFGASVEEHRGEQVAEMLATFHDLFRRIEATRVPTAAVVRGRCLGGGVELAAFCGHVIASPEATFALPEVRLGVFPPMGVIIARWRCGGVRATQYVTLGRTVSAPEAFAAGLVDELAPDPHEAMQRYAVQLSPLSASSLRYAWSAARMPLRERMEQELPRLERLYLEELMATFDANEGISAYLERRPPAYVNQ